MTINIKASTLYISLKFNQKHNVFKYISECQFFINGYYTFQNSSGFPSNLVEDWIFDFLLFTENRLKDMLYPDAEFALTANFSTVLRLYVNDDKERLVIFFNLLDEFVNLHSDSDIAV